MELVLEQVKYLRERKEILLKRKAEFQQYFGKRETPDIEGVGALCYADYQENFDYSKILKEIDEIEDVLRHSNYKTMRNFDRIDVGTGFYSRFEDEDEATRMTLVEAGISTHNDFLLVSLNSDFGQAVKGAREGDVVTYTVKATGRDISLTIEEIDKIQEHYVHFLRDRAMTDRMAPSVEKELKELKSNDLQEYAKRHMITRSQKELVEEELASLDSQSVSRRTFLNKLLQSPVAPVPKGNRIGIGSKVSFILTDGEGHVEEKNVEMINRAVSTELDCHYVERISALGNALYGLKQNDTFKVRRWQKSSLQGVVVSVENEDVKGNVRVR